MSDKEEKDITVKRIIDKVTFELSRILAYTDLLEREHLEEIKRITDAAFGLNKKNNEIIADLKERLLDK
jgi:hypothetical protein